MSSEISSKCEPLDYIRLSGYFLNMKDIAKIFKSLADETRLRILALLIEGELCVCEIMAALALPQSTISRHLAYLRKSGWVSDRRQGVWMYYRLNDKDEVIIRALKPLLKKHVASSQAHADALEKLRKFQEEGDQQGC
jgi:ArsR family transcriptional regulator